MIDTCVLLKKVQILVVVVRHLVYVKFSVGMPVTDSNFIEAAFIKN